MNLRVVDYGLQRSHVIEVRLGGVLGRKDRHDVAAAPDTPGAVRFLAYGPVFGTPSLLVTAAADSSDDV